ncbi:MAG: metallophosphoesterase [Clostridia bacterium]|nr:metallophosphoesterase [Clostridia bacterium]
MWLFNRNKKIQEGKIKNKGEIFEEKLLQEYGQCRPNVNFGLKILFITDTHNCLAYTDKYINYLKSLNQEDYDICLILGDLSGLDFDAIKAVIPNEKLYGIVGNHDSINALEVNNIKNINGQVIECKGVKIAAIMGSNRYKSGDYGMITQEECSDLANNMDSADILVSHDKAYIFDRNDNVHDGLRGITEYIYKNHIPLHIHGHLHEEMEEALKNGTKSIGVYQIKLMEV